MKYLEYLCWVLSGLSVLLCLVGPLFVTAAPGERMTPGAWVTAAVGVAVLGLAGWALAKRDHDPRP